MSDKNRSVLKTVHLKRQCGKCAITSRIRPFRAVIATVGIEMQPKSIVLGPHGRTRPTAAVFSICQGASCVLYSCENDSPLGDTV